MIRLTAAVLAVAFVILGAEQAEASHPRDPGYQWADLEPGGDGTLDYSFCVPTPPTEWTTSVETKWDSASPNWSFNSSASCQAQMTVKWENDNESCDALGYPNAAGCWTSGYPYAPDLLPHASHFDIQRALILIDKPKWDPLSSALKTAVMSHEWGHGMGLVDHFNTTQALSGTLMSSFIEDPPTYTGPNQADLATVKCFIYSRCRDGIGLFSTTGTWGLKKAINPGVSDYTFNFGSLSGTPVAGDWDGNGTTTIGTFGTNAVWALRNSNSGGPPLPTFIFGVPGDKPVVGDWDGDGDETVGVFRQLQNPSCWGQWRLNNQNDGSAADIVFSFGNACTDKPIAGDWNGDGIDTIGVFGQGPNGWGSWALMPCNCGGSVTPFYYGSYSEIPIIGDWDGDGDDTVGTGYVSGCCEAGWSVINYNQGGSPSYPPFAFGSSTDRRVSGNWDGLN